MTNRYVVWSFHQRTEPRGEKRREELKEYGQRPARSDPDYITGSDVVEVTRTERSVAQQDAAIIQDMFRRKAWVQDTEEGK